MLSYLRSRPDKSFCGDINEGCHLWKGLGVNFFVQSVIEDNLLRHLAMLPHRVLIEKTWKMERCSRSNRNDLMKVL